MTVMARVINFRGMGCGALSHGIAVVRDFSGGTGVCQRVSEQIYLLDGKDLCLNELPARLNVPNLAVGGWMRWVRC